MATLEQKAQSLPRSSWRNELWLIPVQVGILVGLLVLWQVSVSQKNLMFFSRPTLVAQRLYELFVGGEIYRHILVTMQEVLIGYALGAGLGRGTQHHRDAELARCRSHRPGATLPEELQSADRRAHHRNADLAAIELGRGIDILDVAQDARLEGNRIE